MSKARAVCSVRPARPACGTWCSSPPRPWPIPGAAIAGLGAEPADPARAHGDYSRTKAEAELLALAADSPDFRVAAVRPHIVWGPGDTQLVERVLERAGRGRLPLLDAGAALIDTTYVDNAAAAIVAAAAPHGAHPRPGAGHQQRRAPPGRRTAGGHLCRGRRSRAVVERAGQARAGGRIGR